MIRSRPAVALSALLLTLSCRASAADALASARLELSLVESSSATTVAELSRALGRFGAAALTAGDDKAIGATIDRLASLAPDAAAVEEWAAILNRTGRFEEGLRVSTAAATRHPEAPGLHRELAASLLGLGRRAEAIAAYRRVLELSPADYEAHLRLAGVYRLEGRFKDASGLFSAAKALAPDRADAYFEEGYVRRDEGDIEGAIRELESAVAANPRDPLARHHLGVFLADAGRIEDAVHSFESARRLYEPAKRTSGMYADTQNYLALQLHALGRHDDALRAFKQAFEDAPPKSLQWLRAATGSMKELQDLGRGAEGLALMERTLKACADLACLPLMNARILSSIAAALRKTDLPRARAFGHRALEILEARPPREARMCAIAGEVVAQYLSLPRLASEKDRIGTLRRALAVCSPPRPSDGYDAKLRMADAYRLQGRFKDASGLYREAQALAPDRAEAYFQEGYSRRDGGDPAGAIAGVQDAMAAHPKNPSLHHHLGVLLAGMGRGGDAVRSFEAALRLYDPSDAEGRAHTRTHLAHQLRVLGRYDDALKTYEEALAAVPQVGPHPFPLASGYLDELDRRGREKDGLPLIERALEGCRTLGCQPLANAQLFVSLARVLRGSDLSLAREHGRRALDILDANPPFDVNQCNIAADMLKEYLMLPVLASERDRLEALGLGAGPCTPKSLSARRAVARGDKLRARGDVRGARSVYCDAYRKAGETERAIPERALRFSGVAEPAVECGKD